MGRLKWYHKIVEICRIIHVVGRRKTSFDIFENFNLLRGEEIFMVCPWIIIYVLSPLRRPAWWSGQKQEDFWSLTDASKIVWEDGLQHISRHKESHNSCDIKHRNSRRDMSSPLQFWAQSVLAFVFISPCKAEKATFVCSYSHWE